MIMNYKFLLSEEKDNRDRTLMKEELPFAQLNEFERRTSV